MFLFPLCLAWVESCGNKCKEVFSCHLDIYFEPLYYFSKWQQGGAKDQNVFYLSGKKRQFEFAQHFMVRHFEEFDETVQYEATAAVNLINWITKSAYQRL